MLWCLMCACSEKKENTPSNGEGSNGEDSNGEDSIGEGSIGGVRAPSKRSRSGHAPFVPRRRAVFLVRGNLFCIASSLVV